MDKSLVLLIASVSALEHSRFNLAARNGLIVEPWLPSRVLHQEIAIRAQITVQVLKLSITESGFLASKLVQQVHGTRTHPGYEVRNVNHTSLGRGLVTNVFLDIVANLDGLVGERVDLLLGALALQEADNGGSNIFYVDEPQSLAGARTANNGVSHSASNRCRRVATSAYNHRGSYDGPCWSCILQMGEGHVFR